MKKSIVGIILCISWALNAQVALPTFQGVQNAGSELYSFSSHTFTNCGSTGKTGPTLANSKSSYDTSREGDTDLFNVQTQGIQEWTVPKTGSYTIEVYGAEGGIGQTSNTTPGGGARMRGTFSLQVNQILKILVGQQGSNGTYIGGGGGGYSGGGGGYEPPSFPGGGGGGSYNSGSNQSNTAGAREGHGQVIITLN